MLAKRIIPCLDIDQGRVVKGVNFVNLVDAGDPIKNAQFYEQEGADELVFLDITASHQQRGTTVDLVKQVADVVFMPFTVGGGISSVEDIRQLLVAGADKVSINTAAVQSPELITQGNKMFGGQCIVVAIDAKKKKSDCRGGPMCPPESNQDSWEVYIHGGRTPTGIDAVEWAKKAEQLGAGEILLTSMDYDGTKDGYDIALTKAIADAVHIPVIASGGAGKPQDFYEVFSQTKATAALAASIFHFREYKVGELKSFLHEKGIEVRR